MSSPGMKNSQASAETTTAPNSSTGTTQHSIALGNDDTKQTNGSSDKTLSQPTSLDDPKATPNTIAVSSSASSVQSSASTSIPDHQPESNPRLEALNQKKAKLEATLAALQVERATLVAASKSPGDAPFPSDWADEDKTKQALNDSHAVIKEHIALLHQYNEIKDIGQGLMGLIADGRGVRVASVMEEFGIEGKD